MTILRRTTTTTIIVSEEGQGTHDRSNNNNKLIIIMRDTQCFLCVSCTPYYQENYSGSIQHVYLVI